MNAPLDSRITFGLQTSNNIRINNNVGTGDNIIKALFAIINNNNNGYAADFRYAERHSTCNALIFISFLLYYIYTADEHVNATRHLLLFGQGQGQTCNPRHTRSLSLCIDFPSLGWIIAIPAVTKAAPRRLELGGREIEFPFFLKETFKIHRRKLNLYSVYGFEPTPSNLSKSQ